MTSTSKISESFKHKIRLLVKQVVTKEHTSTNKHTLKEMPGRIALACPYCGDSSTDDMKKRGNLYWGTLQYHCFNCSYHTDAYGLLKDHGIKLNTDETIEIIDYVKEHKLETREVEVLQHGIFAKVLELAPTKQDLRNKLGFKDIEPGDPAFFYLRNRLLSTKLEHFMYCPKDKRLYILNIGPDDKVIGMQSRTLVKASNSRYLTYDLSKLREWLSEPLEMTEEELVPINKMSTLFGIMQVDMMHPVTVFEGPLDRLFMHNSLALASVNRDTDELDEIPTIRYMFDNDKPGKDKMMQKMKRGKSVFTWERFITKNKLDKYPKQIKDLNDLVIAAWQTKSKCLKEIEDYFSNSPLDAYYL